MTQSRPMWFPPMRAERAPIVAPAPTTQPGPICAVESIRAEGSTQALGCTPATAASGGWKSANAFAAATLGFATRMTTFVAEGEAPDERIAEAEPASAAAKYESFSANVRSPGPALSAEAKPVSTTAGSPSTSPPSSLAM